MQPEPEFNLSDFISTLGGEKIRYLLIGRWAVSQHGIPLVTNDYDFWVHPGDREKFLKILGADFEAELPPRSQWRSPVLAVFVGVDRIDCFFYRRVVNEEGEELVFDDVLGRAELKRDPDTGFSVRIPAIRDLIALKKMGRTDPLKRQRDEEDIRTLLEISKKKRKGK